MSTKQEPMSMSSSLTSRIQRLPQPYRAQDALLPILEAISNSLMSVEERYESNLNENGEITVSMRGTGSDFRCTIVDNGYGMNEDNFDAFITVDTPHKIEKGGKGVGRLFWLAAFNKISIKSVYKEKRDSFLSERSFDFSLSDKDQIKNYHEKKFSESSLLPNDPRTLQTTVTFEGLKNHYATKFPHSKATKKKEASLNPKKIRSIIIGNFLPSLISDTFPRLSVAVEGEDENYSDFVKKNIRTEGPFTKKINKDTTFSLTLLECNEILMEKDAETYKHLIHFVGNERVVTSDNIDTIYGIRETYLGKDGKRKCFRGILKSSFLDNNVNQERTAFTGNASKVDAKYICSLFKDEIKEFLSEPLKKIREEQKRSLNTVLSRYPSIRFGSSEAMLDKLSNLGETEPAKIYSRFSLDRYRKDDERYKEMDKISAHLDKKEKIDEAFNTRVQNLRDSIGDEEQKALSEYVLRRRAILDILKQAICYIKDEPEGKDSDYSPEKIVHSLLCPMRKATVGEKSTEKPIGHDLWVIDERLAFTQFLSSDKPEKDILADSKSLARPDLLVFEQAMAFAQGDKRPNRVMIVEFKRPGKKDYTAHNNPIEQIDRYRSAIKKQGKIKLANGQYASIDKNCVFDCYLIADRLGELEFWTETWFASPSSNRWIAPSDSSLGSKELIEWRQLLEDAELRSAPFFENLGVKVELPPS